jgi:hypothetical protein
MMDPVDRAVRAIARRNSYALIWAQFGIAHGVMLGGLGLLSLYRPMSASDFWILVGVSQVLVGIDNLASIKLTRHMWRPVRAWERGVRDEASTVAAWEALATLPITGGRGIFQMPECMAAPCCWRALTRSASADLHCCSAGASGQSTAARQGRAGVLGTDVEIGGVSPVLEP